MQIDKVDIVNYRSIDHLILDFPYSCQVLIGINESGKSNVLRALQLLDPQTPVVAADLRMERIKEPQVSEGHVRFEFDLDAAQIQLVQAAIHEFVEPNSRGKFFATTDDKFLTIADFCAARCRGWYEVALPSGERSFNYWGLPKDRYKLQDGWARSTTGATQQIDGGPDDAPLIVPPNGFVQLGGRPRPDAFSDITMEELNKEIGSLVVKEIKDNLPKCVFWRYSDQYLLPSSVNIASFVADPSTCVPLRSMFELADYGVGDIGTSITNAKNHSQHRYIQLLRKVETAATAHIREVWKDHKQVRIELQPNGDVLVPIVIDASVPLDMASRSDGFKRFVSFLLQVSAKVRSKELNNVLILVDEPEMGLHPGGARSLMKELVKIGTTNTVVYSTHSIFMVDGDAVNRHLIVQKKNEVTRVERAEKSRIQDEEVLYAAVGYSIFETLKPRNVIFEGWRDKELFRIVSDAMSKSDRGLKEKLAEIGMTYAEGVKDIKHVAGFLELAARPCLIVSDSDAPALEKRKSYCNIGAWGKWATLKDVIGEHITTGEDLINRTAVIKRANKWRGSIPGLVAISDAQFPASKSTMVALAAWVASIGLTGKELEVATNGLKTALYEGLKRDEISTDAEKLVQYVTEHDFTAQ